MSDNSIESEKHDDDQKVSKEVVNMVDTGRSELLHSNDFIVIWPWVDAVEKTLPNKPIIPETVLLDLVKRLTFLVIFFLIVCYFHINLIDFGLKFIKL